MYSLAVCKFIASMSNPVKRAVGVSLRRRYTMQTSIIICRNKLICDAFRGIKITKSSINSKYIKLVVFHTKSNLAKF